MRPVLAALALTLAACSPGPFHGAEISPAKKAPPLVAADGDGRTFRLDELAGRVVLLTFGYTHCPDVCPMTLARARALRRALGEAGRDVSVALVTLDPQRDTPDRLATYVRAFDPEFRGLSLAPAQLDRTTKDFGISSVRRVIARTPSEERDYHFDHTSGFVVVDRQGRLRLRLPLELTVDQMASDVRRLLAEKEQ